MTSSKESRNGYAEINDVQLYYETEGEGSDLVFIHAGCADSRMWDGQFSIFAHHYQVLRYDARGYGNSTLSKSSFSNRDELSRLLDVLSIKQAHFVACSMGSYAVIDFALEHPEKIRSLVLVSPAVSGYPYEGQPPQPVMDMIDARKTGNFEFAAELQAQIWADGFKRNPEHGNPEVHELVRQMSLDSLTLQADIIRESAFLIEEPLNPPAMEQLEQIRVPVLVIVGDLDDDTEMAIADVLTTRINGAQKTIIRGTAHLPNMEKPEEFNQIVLKFLQEI
jgi:Predicted hydrolases or acyltransferases (alpha/beta hydrolase superfamily)